MTATERMFSACTLTTSHAACLYLKRKNKHERHGKSSQHTASNGFRVRHALKRKKT